MAHRTTKNDLLSLHINRAGGFMAAMGAGLIVTGPVEADTTFTSIFYYPSVNDVIGVQHHELTGDGLIDFATLERFGKVMTFKSLGFGKYAVETKVEGNGKLREHLRIGDVDGNGTPDYVWNESTAVFIYYTRPSGDLLRLQSFTDSDSPVDIELGDIDHDGDLDIVTTSKDTARVFMNRDHQGFTMTDTLSLMDPSSEDIVSGDFDFDGDLDIAVLTTDYYDNYRYGIKVYNSHISVFLNNGSGNFDMVSHVQLPYGQNGVDDSLLPKRFAAGDLDNDGDQDFVVSAEDTYDYYNSEVLLVENIFGSTSFKTGVPLVFDAGTYRDKHILPIQVADINLDGNLDIVVSRGSSNGEFTTINGNGDNLNFQGFNSSGVSPVGLINSIQIDDFDQDGFPDLLLGGDNGVAVLSNNADRFFGPFLRIDPIKKGQSTTMTVSETQPGKTVFWMYRRGLPVEEAPVAEFGGMIFEVGSQFSVAGSAVADNTGTAILNIPVPRNAPSDLVTIQAVVQGDPDGTNSRKTNFHTTRVQP